MALHIPKAPGLAQMLKDGAKHYAGLEEAVYRNLNACKELASTVKSAYGPRGLNKMVINHIEKLFVTNDAATILNELDVEHPAAKLVVLASKMQEQEVGDGTNFVIIFAGALLEAAEDLLRMGLTPSEVTEGYEKALKTVLKVLPDLVCHDVHDIHDHKQVIKAIRSSVMSKQYGNEDFLADLISKACTAILPESGAFNVDNVRVCKIPGGGLNRSDVLQGMVFTRQVEGDVTKKTNAKVAVYSCAFDMMAPETKGTVLIHSAEELKSFSKGEESVLDDQIKSIADAGVNVIVSGGKIGDLCLHFLNKYNIMAVRLNSKWDIRRVSKVVGATVLPKMATPTKDELGFCDQVYVSEVGDSCVVIFKQESKESRISTIVIRGATDNYMDDIERAIDDGVNTFKGISKDGRLLPGAGAVEIELAKEVTSFGESCPGLDQYAIKKFAVALESIPKAIAENAGIKTAEVVTALYASHQEGNKNVGVDIESEGVAVIDATKAEIYDLYANKYWGLKYAVNAACTILKIDQVFMSKAAGGPKPKANENWDED
ncbi:T-complex protein 1 subunit theta [Chamberlinius hualienensis]